MIRFILLFYFHYLFYDADLFQHYLSYDLIFFSFCFRERTSVRSLCKVLLLLTFYMGCLSDATATIRQVAFQFSHWMQAK